MDCRTSDWRLRASVLRQRRLCPRSGAASDLALSDVEVVGGRAAEDRFFIEPGYRPGAGLRFRVEGPPPRRVFQPGVYATAGRIAEVAGSRTIIDIGCGWGEKLVTLSARFDIVGLDLDENLEYCRTHYSWGEWLAHDLETPEPLPLSDRQLRNATVVCADVIEHLVRPDRLLNKLHSLVDRVDAILLSTPDRDLEWRRGHRGPPPNPHHVREWSQHELGMFLRCKGFESGVVTHTRPRTGTLAKRTLLAAIVPTRLAAQLSREAPR